MEYVVYMLRCSDDSLYTGITNNLEKRLRMHREKKGSKYVASRLPFSVVFLEKWPDCSSALKRESAIKRLSKKEKEMLIH